MSQSAIQEQEAHLNYHFPAYDPDDGSFSTGASAPIVVQRFNMETAAVQFTISSGGDYTLEASIDGMTWLPLQANVTASAVFNFNAAPNNHFWRYLRVTVNTAGVDDVVTLGAHAFLS